MVTKKDIFTGTAFVFTGLIYALCDRWQRELVVQGVRTRRPHKFDHLFVMWMLKQFLQLSLLLLHKLTVNGWFTCAPFRFGQKNQRGEQALRRFPPENAQLIIQNNDDEPLLPNGNNGNHIQHEAEQPAQEVVPVRKRKNTKPSFLVFFPPSFFALAHTLLLYFGLKLTYNSSFMMLKGTVAFFTALLSLAFLAQQLACYVWFGVVVATLGFVVCGISDYIHNPDGGYEKYGIAAGDLLIVMAQIMFATKIIYEQKFIKKYLTPPTVFLGYEGIYGSFFAVIFLLVFNFLDAVQYSNLPNGRLEDVMDFAVQFSNSWQVILAVFGCLSSYILYTYLGLVLVKEQGALARIMIETFIWSIYWAVCLAIHWENFFIAQVPGLCVITIGVLIYSNILGLPCTATLEELDENRHGNDNVQVDVGHNDDVQPVDERDRPPEPIGPAESDEELVQAGDDDDDDSDDELLAVHGAERARNLGNVVMGNAHQNEAENVRRRV